MYNSFYLVVMVLTLSSCANIKHMTNVNFKDMKSIKHNKKLQRELNEKVHEITLDRSQKCSFIKDYKASDNVFETGEKYAKLYFKLESKNIDANAVVFEKTEKKGNYGHTVYGKIFKCPKL